MRGESQIGHNQNWRGTLPSSIIYWTHDSVVGRDFQPGLGMHDEFKPPPNQVRSNEKEVERASHESKSLDLNTRKIGFRYSPVHFQNLLPLLIPVSSLILNKIKTLEDGLKMCSALYIRKSRPKVPEGIVTNGPVTPAL